MLKRGSLNLSINAIVVVVLAFVMLGLGLTLTRTVFKDIGSTSGSINEQIRQQILDDLRTGNKPLSFPQNKVTVEFGKERTIAFGVKNTGSSAAFYCIDILAREKNGDNDAGIEFYFDTDMQSLNAQNTVVIPATVDSRGASQGQGLYRGKIIVYETLGEGAECTGSYDGGDWKVHAQKSFFITIQ
jgi:hypothetical protein